MANSYVRYTGNGVTTSFSLTFDYLSQDDIVVTVDGVAATFTWLNDTTVSISPAPANGLVVEVRRVTPSDIPAVDFQNGAVVTEDQLDTNAKQALYVSQEAEDDANDKLGKDEDLNWDAASKKIRNVADPVLDNDAANKGWVVDQIAADVAAAAASATAAAASETAAAASEAAAAASETAAAASETAAAASETAAASSASAASTSASAASTSASAASTSASAASTSATNAATSATNASNSASAASTSATNASSSASAAATSASAASTSASAASTSASAASTSATDAATSATAAAASAATLTGTSTTSNTPAVGSMTWTTQAGKAWTAGAYVQISSAGTPAVWAFGQVTSYSSTTLIVDVQAIGTASAKTDWNINYAGVRGAAGASGATITVGSTAVASGTTTRVLYNNSGSVGEYQVTGSGKVVMDTSPVLVTPTLGTPASGVLTNCTGLPAAGVNSGALANGMTATSQAQASNDTKLATNAYVDRVAIQQTQTSMDGAVATGTTAMFNDNTIPQNTEGDQYLSVSITPKSATSKLRINALVIVANSGGAGALMAALFQDSTANALKSAIVRQTGAGESQGLSLFHEMTSGTTSATTFKVRAGSNAGGTTTFNGTAGSGLFGGTMTSYISVQEIGV